MRLAFQRCPSLPKSLSLASTIYRRTTQRRLQPAQSTSIGFATPYRTTRSFFQSPHCNQPAAAAAAAPASSGSDGFITTFEGLGASGTLHANIASTLIHQMGIKEMTEVQAATINEAIKGTDIIAQARTGTGKTLAFLLPILQRILNADPHLAERKARAYGQKASSSDIRGIIISPTRELAEQIAVEAKRVTQNTGIVVQTAVGGTQKRYGLHLIQREGCHLLVGTPGRLKDILTDPTSYVEAPDLAALVLDEADRLMDDGFWPDIQEIMGLLPDTKVKDRQTLLFSATLPKEVMYLVRSSLKPGFQFVKCVQDNDEPTHQRVPQKLIGVRGIENAFPTLLELFEKGFNAAKEPNAKPFKAIVYFSSTVEVTLAASTLQHLEVPADVNASSENSHISSSRPHPYGRATIQAIHGRLDQRDRTRAAQKFRNCESGILLSSDVTARGMDFPNVSHVIQVGLPSCREQYIHRIGRTGRAGKEGEGLIILDKMELQEAQHRLKDLPLKRDESLTIPKLDLTKPGNVPSHAGLILGMYQKAIRQVPYFQKRLVYLAKISTHQFFRRKNELVNALNNLCTYGWGLESLPGLSRGLAYKLNLHGIEGIKIVAESDQEDSDRGPGNSFGGGSRGGSEYGGRGFGSGPRGGSEYGGRGFGSGPRGGSEYGGRGFGSGPRRESGFNDRGSYGSPRGGSGFGDRGSYGSPRGGHVGSGPRRDSGFNDRGSYGSPRGGSVGSGPRRDSGFNDRGSYGSPRGGSGFRDRSFGSSQERFGRHSSGSGGYERSSGGDRNSFGRSRSAGSAWGDSAST